MSNYYIFVSTSGSAEGVVTACIHNNAVHIDLLNQIYGRVTAGAQQDDIIECLRLKTVPTGYNIHTWLCMCVQFLSDTGKDETSREAQIHFGPTGI